MSLAQATLGEFVDPAVDFGDAGRHMTTPRFRLRNKSRRQARQLYWDEYDRETYECPTCGVSDATFHVHHRNGDPLDNRLINLLAICAYCHRQEHRDRVAVRRMDEWRDKFADYFGEMP
jgi:hypothetical protein